MSCTQCIENPKYKCPVCRTRLCSLSCFKEHKSSPCSAPPEPKKESIDTHQSQIAYEFSTEDTVPVEKLNMLEQSQEVKKCLENPHVREILDLLDTSPYPDRMMEKYMKEPIFTEFVDACLKIVQPEDNSK